MNEENYNVQYKCGVCKWAFPNMCTNFEEHLCCETFNENLHVFVKDDESFIFMALKESVPNNNNNDNDNIGKLRWTNNAELCLISLYKKYYNDFMSTKEKNSKVWNRLSDELIAQGFKYSPDQCKFKFKYLKCKYMRKIDNMKSTASGQGRVNFKYFQEMDDIFGKKPNVQPTSLASNLCKRKINTRLEEPEEPNIIETENEEHTRNENDINDNQSVPETRNKSKKSSIDALINQMRDREKARQERHEENLQFKNRLLEAYNTKMDALIAILKKE